MKIYIITYNDGYGRQERKVVRADNKTEARKWFRQNYSWKCRIEKIEEVEN